ncbi:unnamed protein product [Calypogeia fissa]
MAKTKRRQLAALAAQAELKELAAQAELKGNAGCNERTSSCDKSGPSGTIPQAGDPMVEIRTQRVIFKIPALPPPPPPPKPAAATQPPLKIAKRQGFGNRRRKKLQTDSDPDLEQVPADKTKISIFQLGRWKRHKNIRDLLPPIVQAVPSPSAGLSNGGQPAPVANSVATDDHTNGGLSPAGAGFQKPSRRTVLVVTGPRKRAKVQELVLLSPTEKDGKITKTRARSEGPIDRTLDRAASSLVTSNRRSRGNLVKDSDRLQELARASDGDLPSTLAHSPATSRKRRRGSSKQVISQVPGSPKATVVSPHRTRSRVKISHCEATALEVLQEIQNVKNISQPMENRSKIVAENDTRLVRSAATADGEAIHNTTRDKCQPEPQISGNFTSPLTHGEAHLTHVGVAPDYFAQELMQRGAHTSVRSCVQSNGPGHFKSHVHIEEPHMPFASGKQGVFLVVPQKGKDLGNKSRHSGGNGFVPREAEIIKRHSQLTIMEKRLKAAGGLRNWLLDKGLGQFLPILDKWNIDNLSLMQLTMEGLKSMGLLPVGPRRKLIHAISSLTLPSFSKPAPLHANPR